MKKLFCLKTVIALALALTTFMGVSLTWAEPWKFGVMGDTQWTTSDPANANPYTVPVSIINQVNRQFINAGVKFVIEVGDLTDDGNDISEVTRAAAAQPLIDAGIGFFPLRGNHETYGTNNNYAIPIFQSNYPQTQTGTFTKSNGYQYKLGINFSSPILVSTDLAGMSYSFDYGNHDNNARFVIMDTWATPSKVDNNPDGYAYGYTVNDQQGWISDRLGKKTRGTEHAFVFSHQPLIAENHQDTMFSGYTNANPAWQNTFFASLRDNGVRYFISGHDHIHQRSIIASPDGTSKVQEIISASNSSKFYTPKPLNDAKWFGQKTRETSVSQERYTVGYYIYTVDGPCVTVDYYSDDHGNWGSDNCYPNGTTPQSCGVAGGHITPIFNFVKKETWGYCQNGKEFLVPQATTYKTVLDSFHGATAQILDGTNNSTAQDYTLRPFTKTVNTGWFDMNRWCEQYPVHQWNPDLHLASNIFRLSGMTDLDSQQTDTYVLSLSYEHDKLLPQKLGDGALVLVTRDETGRWVNAIDMNFGGIEKFVLGPWNSSYGLGAYGVDPNTHTAWAVINYNGDFAVAGFEKH
jgi:hypothetical protein